MAKADKATVLRRIQEVMRLIMAGGEFDDIRQYASGQGWDISDRQLRRYQGWAYQRIVEATERDQRKLMARHLMQRRALYARALKTSDVRTALHVLRDEAVLEGLYPSAATGKAPCQELLYRPRSPLSRAERFKRMLAAEANGDEKELALIEHLTPKCTYRLTDLTIPAQMLNTMAMVYAAEQLDHAAMYLAAVWQITVGTEDAAFWTLVGGVHAYLFKVGFDGWRLFAADLGIDGDELVRTNHAGTLLELFSGHICDDAPTLDVVLVSLAAEGAEIDWPRTAERDARTWRNLLDEALRD